MKLYNWCSIVEPSSESTKIFVRFLFSWHLRHNRERIELDMCFDYDLEKNMINKYTNFTFKLKRFGVYWSTQNSFFSKSLTMCPILVCHLQNVWRLRMNILQLSLLDHCCRTYTGHSIRPKFCCCLPQSEEYCSRHTNQWPTFCTWLLHSCWPVRTILLWVNQKVK